MSEKKPSHTNRLIQEKSPYLLQHAHNPVDWYPWGEEAFEKARKLDKPIFLSIGYATCHWCHIMERESFENQQIAKLMNDAFINIKVDREELPEIDSLYMEFAQSMMSGSAGWPLNVILTPTLKPFFAATYLPPEPRQGLLSMPELINRILILWHGEERSNVLSQAEQIVDLFKTSSHSQGKQLSSKSYVDTTADFLFQMADPIYGGLKGAPKFPIAYQLHFLMNYSALTNDGRSLFFAEKTLEMMQRGGIYDHLGGGFSRYSIDERWLIPHFEKMLYDNALLSMTYLSAWQITHRPLYREVCEQTLLYVLRDLKDPQGGFYSAEDADSEGVEGKFYTWTIEEAKEVLNDLELELFCDFYDLTPGGNFDKRNILNTPLSLEEFAAKCQVDPGNLSHQLAIINEKLLKKRQDRTRPFKDDKVLSGWNGLMLRPLAHAGLAFDNPTYLEAALQAATFIKNTLWDGNHLLRRWRDGEALHKGALEEYAFMIQGSLQLFQVGLGTEWLIWALEMTKILEEQFKVEKGAFYMTDGTDKNLILRKCQFSDGAEPSGNAIHCENLLTLHQITKNDSFLHQAEDILKAVHHYLDLYPPGYIYHIKNLQRYYDTKAPTLVIALNEKEEWKKEIAQAIFQKCIAHKTVIWLKKDDHTLLNTLPFLQKQTPIERHTTLYLCYQGTCKEPLHTLDSILDAIQHL